MHEIIEHYGKILIALFAIVVILALAFAISKITANKAQTAVDDAGAGFDDKSQQMESQIENHGKAE